MKRKYLSYIIAIFFCIFMVVFNSACTGNQKKKIPEKDKKEEKEIGELQKTEEKEYQPEQEKKKIIIYTDKQDTRLTTGIERFNQENETYEAQVTDYSGSYLVHHDMLSPEERMEKKIQEDSGDWPDVLYWSDDSLIKRYGRQNLLMDFWPLLVKDTEISEKVYDPTILSLLGEKLYQFPDSFSFEVLLGNKKMMGDRQSWTAEEMQSLYQKLPEPFMFMLTVSKKNYIGKAFCYQQSDYIDPNTGNIHVETEDFMNILRFAKQLPDEEADIYCGRKWKEETMIPKGHLLLTEGTIWNEDDLEQYHKKYKKAGGFNILSYPSIENNGLLLNVSMLPFAIPVNAKNKEAAWELIRFFIREKIQNTQDKNNPSPEGFPARRDMLKESLKACKKRNRILIKSMLKRVGRVHTGSELRYGFDGESTEVIENILWKYAKAYFDGTQTVEEAAKKIQKELELFVVRSAKQA